MPDSCYAISVYLCNNFHIIYIFLLYTLELLTNYSTRTIHVALISVIRKTDLISFLIIFLLTISAGFFSITITHVFKTE